MRRFALAATIAITCASPAYAADCSADVSAAFEKQRAAKTYRISMTQPTAEGPVDMTVDYILPDRMLQTVVSPAMPGDQQTMLVGDRAFSGSSGAFEEMLPHFTQSIVSEFKSSTSGALQNLGKFECLGKQSLDGKDYLAFRAADPAATDGGDVLARTIFVDETSGLPAYNVVAALSGKGDPAMKVAYSYPTDTVIEAPKGASVQKRAN